MCGLHGRIHLGIFGQWHADWHDLTWPYEYIWVFSSTAKPCCSMALKMRFSPIEDQQPALRPGLHGQQPGSKSRPSSSMVWSERPSGSTEPSTTELAPMYHSKAAAWESKLHWPGTKEQVLDSSNDDWYGDAPSGQQNAWKLFFYRRWATLGNLPADHSAPSTQSYSINFFNMFHYMPDPFTCHLAKPWGLIIC